MTITKIETYGKTRDRVLFDEGLVLLFYKSETRKLGLADGMEISGEFYEHSILPLLIRRAKLRLVNILKSADKTEEELRRKLRESYYPPEAAEAALDWCREKHYVDDRRYAENYIRYHSEGKSRKKLSFDLAAKGVPREIIRELLEEAEVDEDSQIRAELEKRKYTRAADDKARQRIISALARKGYSWSAIESAILSLQDESGEM